MSGICHISRILGIYVNSYTAETCEASVGALALLLVQAFTGRLISGEITAAARDVGGHLEEDLAKAVVVGIAVTHHLQAGVAIFQKVHDNGATAVGAGMLGEVVASRELLATLMALEGLVLGVQRPVVTLQVFLAPEAAVAKLAHKRLGRILSQGLLTTATGRRGRERGGGGSLASIRARGGVVVVASLVGIVAARRLLAGLASIRGAGGDVHGGRGCASFLLGGLLLLGGVKILGFG